MKKKYKTLFRNKGSILFWCQSSNKALFLVPAALLCLLCVSLFGLNCLSSKDQSYFCSVFFNKSFESLDYEIEFSPNLQTYTKSLASSAVEDNVISNNDDGLIKETLAKVYEMRKRIYTENNKQTVRNEDKFGPITNNTIIIVVQVHKNLEYLQVLLKSLEHAKYIEDTLLVFSHGFYSEEINDAVHSIQFARVLQIFYPYGLQTHPNTFPEFSPNDWLPGVTQEGVKGIQYQGQTRGVESLQEKHNWWWTVNMVFNGLTITKAFHGLVLFLEEDHYVLPDVIHVLRLMRHTAPVKCPDCNIFGLGFIPEYTTVEGYKSRADKLHVIQWNNMGYAIDRQFWSGLSSRRCSDMFCEYNDYNWDFTLAYLSHKCLPQDIKTLNFVSPRVFRIGECFSKFHSMNCSPQKSLKLIRSLQQDVSEFLFPSELTVSSTYYRKSNIDRRKGGWDDPRDIQLCKNISQL